MSLKHYVRMAYEVVGLTQEHELHAIESLNGTLQSGRENLLLVYAGSFNPPHQGHIDAVLSGLRPEVAAVGIVILPSEDWYLRDKVANKNPDFFLPQERRADLLAAIPSIPKARVWVWTTTWYPFRPFTDALLRLTKADGFNLAIARLVGPDNLNTKDPLNIMPFEFPAVVITNRARHFADQFRPNGKPVRWDGFGEWTDSKRGGGDGSCMHCFQRIRSLEKLTDFGQMTGRLARPSLCCGHVRVLVTVILPREDTTSNI